MSDDLRKKLDEPIPKQHISHREQAGLKLEYLSGAYVIDRLNQVLGQGCWHYQVVELSKVFEGKVQQRSGITNAVSYTATVALTADIGGKSVCFKDVGYGDGTDRANPGKAHELAVKEAVTDGVKRAAKNLGRGMGLELYDKELPVKPREEIAPNKIVVDQNDAPPADWDDIEEQAIGTMPAPTASFDRTVKTKGMEYILTDLMERNPTGAQFYQSVLQGFKKYKKLTEKQLTAVNNAWDKYALLVK